MDKVEKPDEAANPSGGDPRTGPSGEGSRSALEHLLEQEKHRQAQRPVDIGRPWPAEPLP